MSRTAWICAVGLVLGLATVATAEEEGAAARLERLARALEAQAAEIERLRRELGAGSTPEEGTDATAPSAPGPVPRVAPPGSPSGPPRTGGGAGPRATRSSEATDERPPLPLAMGVKRSVPESTLDQTAADVLGTPARRRSYRGNLGGVQLGGYLTLEYVANSAKNSFFDLHRFVLQINAPLSESIGITGEIEWEHGGVDTSYLDGEIKIEYLDVLFQVHDAFNPKLGALLIPFARFNLYHDDPLNDFTMRPLTGRYFVPAGFGQPGIGAEGVFGLGCVGALSYNVAVTTGFGEDINTEKGVRDARQAWQRDNNESKQVWGRLVGILDVPGTDNVELGLSGTWGRYDDEDRHDLFGFATDWNVMAGPFELEGEYIVYDLDRDGDAPIEDPRRQSGLWAEAAYHFFPCGWNCPRRPFVTWTSHFTLAFRYQHLDLNDRLSGGSLNDDLQTYGVALNYRITEDTVFRVDWTYFDAKTEDDRTEFTASFSTYF